MNTHPDWQQLAAMALAEDRATQDITTNLIGDAGRNTVTGRFVAEEPMVVAGGPVVGACLEAIEANGRYDERVAEGEHAGPGDVIGEITTSARSLLAVERVSLNVLQRLCAVATATRQAVQAVRGTRTQITDTRKTTPGLRAFEKYAVRIAGGTNHRESLADAVLFKDNHWALADTSVEFFRAARASVGAGTPFQVEVETVEQLDMVTAAGVTFVLVDNQTPDTIRSWRERIGPDVVLEASGGITVDRVAEYAAAGVDRISLGALTHSAGSVSIRLDVD